MSLDWTNPCGGTRWRELDDGSIEVEGAGIPLYDPGHERHDIVLGTWENWGCLLAEAAARYGVPTSWLLAIACVETGPWWEDAAEQSDAVSYAGARGIMQIMPSTARLLEYEPDQMFQPSLNIDAGAKLIARIAEHVTSGLPAICGAYNSGKICCSDPAGCRPGCGANPYRVCTDGDYPGAAIKYNNTAIAYLDLSACRGGGFMVATLGLFGVGAWGFYRWWKRR